MKIVEVVAQAMFFIRDTKDPQGDLVRGAERGLFGFAFHDMPSLQQAIARMHSPMNNPVISIFTSAQYDIGAGTNGEDVFQGGKWLGRTSLAPAPIAQLVGFPPPEILYHVAPTEERQSVMQHGLLRRMSYSHGQALGDGITSDDDPWGGIFFASKPEPQQNFDLWAVNTKGLHLEADATTEPEHPEDTWWVTYDEDIPPSRMTLVAPG